MRIKLASSLVALLCFVGGLTLLSTDIESQQYCQGYKYENCNETPGGSTHYGNPDESDTWICCLPDGTSLQRKCDEDDPAGSYSCPKHKYNSIRTATCSGEREPGPGNYDCVDESGTRPLWMGFCIGGSCSFVVDPTMPPLVVDGSACELCV